MIGTQAELEPPPAEAPAPASVARFMQGTASSRETKRAVPIDGGGNARGFLQAAQTARPSASSKPLVPEPPASARPAVQPPPLPARANRSAGTIGMEFQAFFESPNKDLPDACGWGNPIEVGLHPSRPTTASDGFVNPRQDLERPDFLPSLKPKPLAFGGGKLSKWKMAAKQVVAGRFRDKLKEAAAARKAAKESALQKLLNPGVGSEPRRQPMLLRPDVSKASGSGLVPNMSGAQRAAAHLQNVEAQAQMPRLGLDAVLNNMQQRPATVGATTRRNINLSAAMLPEYPPLIESAPPWMKITPDIARAASSFEAEHAGRFAKAATIHCALSPRGRTREHSPRMELARSWVTYEICSNRYVPPAQKLQVATTFKPKAKKKPKEKETRNVWAARAEWADSNDVYDTEEVEQKRARHDWPHIKLILVPTLKKYEKSSGDVTEDIKEIMLSSQDILVKIFEFYASLGKSIHTVSINAWEQFLNDFKFVHPKSKFCKRSDLDLIFVSVDSACERLLQQQMDAKKDHSMTFNDRQQQAKEDKKRGGVLQDEKKALGRVEFMAALVLLSVNRHLLSGNAQDPAESFFMLVNDDIEPAFDPAIFAASNAFRVGAYEKSCNDEILRHDESLRNIFEVLCASTPKSKKLHMIDLDIWMDFLRRLDLIGTDVTIRDAKLCFTWSRMMVIEGSTERGRQKEDGLPYEGFLEALCRLSVLKALPFDSEVESMGFSDAGALYVSLHHIGDASTPSSLDKDALQNYKKELNSRAVPWGAEPLQPLSRTVAHLIAIIIRVIDSRGNRSDLKISLKEAEFIYRRAEP